MSALLELLDEEISIRNTHTHKQFLNLILGTGQDIFDLQDALLDLQRKREARKKLERFLRKEVRRLAELYGNKVTATFETTWRFPNAADELLEKRQGTPDHPAPGDIAPLAVLDEYEQLRLRPRS